jgi:fructose-1,6-bisphosphatase/inositol monophosphatase family enzyme
LIVEEAGGVVTDHHGHAFRFNLFIPASCFVAAPSRPSRQAIERTSLVDL